MVLPAAFTTRGISGVRERWAMACARDCALPGRDLDAFEDALGELGRSVTCERSGSDEET